MKKQRNSSVEILRFLLMLLIVVWHSLVHGAGLTSIGNIPNFGISYLPTLIICSIAAVAVDCFMLISGYFGIRFSWKGLANLVFSCLFYSVGISIVLGKFTPPNLQTILCPLTSYVWWFMSCYVIVYLLSGLIEKTIENVSKQKYLLLLLMSYIFLYLWHWIFGKIGGKPLGQPMLMITIYLIGRYCGKYGLPMFVEKRTLLTYVLSVLSIVAIIMVILFIPQLPKPLIWFVYTNGNPLVILSAMSLFSLFLKRQYYNKWVNKLSGSVLSIYLITDFTFIRGMVNNRLYSYYQSDFLKYIFVIVVIMVACVAIDFIRKICFNYCFEKINTIFK